MHPKSNIDSFALLLGNNHLQIHSLEKKNVWGFFSLGFWKFIMTPLPAYLSQGDPFWCKTLDCVVEQSSGIDFMLETLRRKFILVSLPSIIMHVHRWFITLAVQRYCKEDWWKLSLLFYKKRSLLQETIRM